jgi:hypothetical protein
VLKKTSAAIGLVIAAAAAAPLTSSPADAHASMLRGGWHSHHRYSSHSHHRNRNWNGNRHHGRIFIRIYIYNKNNNHAVAVARPERREARPAAVVGDAPLLGPVRGLATDRGTTRTGRDFAGPGQVPTVPED